MRKLLCLLLLLLAACSAKSPEEARELINTNIDGARERIKSVFDAPTPAANEPENVESETDTDTPNQE